VRLLQLQSHSLLLWETYLEIYRNYSGDDEDQTKISSFFFF
jgi:hypothetical protein